MKDSSECDACGVWGQHDVAHIKTVGSGGKNGPDDVLNLCRLDHRLQHAHSWSWMIERYPHLKDILFNKGWIIVNEFNVPKLRRIK